MTVYELIQQLTVFDPDLEVCFSVWATPKQIEDYVAAWKSIDGRICLNAKDEDEVGFGWIPGKSVDITLEVKDL